MEHQPPGAYEPCAAGGTHQGAGGGVRLHRVQPHPVRLPRRRRAQPHHPGHPQHWRQARAVAGVCAGELREDGGCGHGARLSERHHGTPRRRVAQRVSRRRPRRWRIDRRQPGGSRPRPRHHPARSGLHGVRVPHRAAGTSRAETGRRVPGGGVVCPRLRRGVESICGPDLHHHGHPPRLPGAVLLGGFSGGQWTCGPHHVHVHVHGRGSLPPQPGLPAGRLLGPDAQVPGSG
mmetsp:Transcript_18316/g.45618  ORF Transcript_18316/g.45618 Transcript_18316/m.45618 type:complete len:233 (-) Transcript_18316:1042-1740(-)